jgi:hypothetical protein
MPNPTSHSPTVPAPARARVSGLTAKGQLAAQLVRLERLVDGLTDTEQASLADELAPIVRCAQSRVAFRQSVKGQVAS